MVCLLSVLQKPACYFHQANGLLALANHNLAAFAKLVSLALFELENDGIVLYADILECEMLAVVIATCGWV